LGRGCPATGAFTSRRGTGEGLLALNSTSTRDRRGGQYLKSALMARDEISAYPFYKMA